MSNTVDKRIVEMGFDNKQFESGVKTSLDSINSLKKGLEFGDVHTKGLTNLSNLIRSLPIGGIGEGVANIASKFSILGAIGFSAIQNITDSVMALGKKLWDLISPINAAKQGLSEYEIQINAIQTILANTSTKGTTMDQVNAALEQLNVYADKTIYNFGEMTKNIGTFTAAGIDLDASVAAIKGIANLAAVSGSNSQQASTAMYQLSQALSTGSLKLQDWNSVVNAGMGGQIFQDALKETARAHGIAVDDIIKKEGSFRASLTEGWITSSILTETLSKFTGDLTAEQLKSMGYTEDQIKAVMKLGQTANDAATKVKTFSALKETLNEAIGSGWAQTWKIIVGDFEEAKSFFTNVSDILGGMINQSSTARNNLLSAWKDFGGRKTLVTALENAFKGVLSIITPIKDALKEIFPPTTANQLYIMTLYIGEFARKLTVSGETAEKIKRIFKGFFSALDIGRRFLFAFGEGFLNLVKSMSPAGKSIIDFLANMGDYISNLRNGLIANDSFNKTVQKFGEYISLARDRIINFVNIVKEKFQTIAPFFDKFKKSFDTFIDSFSAKFEIVRNWLSGIFNNVDTGGVDVFFDKISKRFEPLKALGKLLVTVLSGIINVVRKLAPTFFKIASKVGEVMMKFAQSIGEGISNLDFSKVFDVINTGVLTALLLGIRTFVTKGSGALDDVGDVFKGIKGMFSGVTGILDGVRGSLEAWQQNLKAKTLFLIAGAIALLTVSLIALSLIDSEKLTIALVAITALFADLMASMAVFSAAGGGGVQASISLIAMAIAVLLLSTAVSKLAKIDREDLKKGLASISDLTIVLVIFSRTMATNSGDLLKGSAGLILFAIALNILVGAVSKLGEIDPVKLTNGLIGVGVLMAELALFMQTSNLDKMGISKGIGILALAGAVVILSMVVAKFSEMDTDKLQKGLAAVGILLTELAIFTQLTGDSKKVIATAVGMAILGGAMAIFAKVIETLGSMSWEQIGKGLFAMATALLIMSIAVQTFPKDMILIGLGLVIVATSLVILAKALESMGNMSWDELTRGLVALGASLTILAIAMQVMQSSIGGAAAMLIVAAAIAIFAPALVTLGSMSLSEIGIGLLALAGAFTILGIAGYLLTPVIPTLLGLGVAMALIGVSAALIGIGILAFSTGLAALAVSGVAGVSAFILMVTMLVGLVPMLVSAIVNAIVMFVKLIGDAVPIIAEAFTKIMLALLDVIIKVGPQLIITVLTLLLALIDLINKVVPPFIDALMNLIDELLTSLAERLPDFIESGVSILKSFLKGIRDNIADIVTMAIDIVTNFIDAVAAKLPDIIDSGFNLIISFIEGLADGIDENLPELKTAIGKLATAIIKGLSDGLSSGVGSVAKAIGKLASGAIDALKTLLGIFSPSTVFYKFGALTTEGFADGLISLGSSVLKAAINIGNNAVTGISKAIKTISNSLNENIDFIPTIRPVVDLTDVISGGRQIDSLLRNKTLSISGVSGVASNISSISNGLLPKNITQDLPNKVVPEGASITYTQINNSPVALSRIEIYRQTRNQLLTLKGALRSTNS